MIARAPVESNWIPESLFIVDFQFHRKTKERGMRISINHYLTVWRLLFSLKAVATLEASSWFQLKLISVKLTKRA